MTTKKLIGKIHLWLGLASGLVVFILGITGCILAFEYELKDIIYKDRYFVPERKNVKPMPVQALINSARQVLGKNDTLTGIGIYRQVNHTASVTAYQSNPAGWNYFDSEPVLKTVFIDPYTARVVYVENTKTEFFRLMLMLHYDLLMNKIGKQIIGWSTIIFIILLISGLVLWWPKNKAAAKQRFAFKWKDTTKWKRKNYDLHNILGFYTLIFALIIALTGLVWAFRWFDNGMQWVANGGYATPEEKQYLSDTTRVKYIEVYDDILRDMRKQAHEDYYWMQIPQEKPAAIYAYAQTESRGYKWTGFYYDQNTGKNLSTTKFADKVPGEQLRGMNYYIHTGAILSMPGKILAFIVSFICAGLPVTGFYIWLGRNDKNKKKKPLPKLR